MAIPRDTSIGMDTNDSVPLDSTKIIGDAASNEQPSTPTTSDCEKTCIKPRNTILNGNVPNNGNTIPDDYKTKVKKGTNTGNTVLDQNTQSSVSFNSNSTPEKVPISDTGKNALNGHRPETETRNHVANENGNIRNVDTKISGKADCEASTSVDTVFTDQDNSELDVNPGITDQASRELGVNPDITDQANSELSVNPGITDQANSELGVNPDITDQASRELGVNPGITDQANSELSVNPGITDQANSELGVNPEITDQANSELGVKTEITDQANSELGVNPEITDQANSELGVDNQITDTEVTEVTDQADTNNVCEPTTYDPSPDLAISDNIENRIGYECNAVIAVSDDHREFVVEPVIYVTPGMLFLLIFLLLSLTPDISYRRI
ncbi:uncharacterized protein LOC110461900 [Mizuhopecten yessoensis]|uniref:Thioredoxin domain-containing protein 2 n=1 Tax=Mizuhopecten yessoensis TaxID=6573 RepID=A0A210PZC6_MIZYE|nr:uncharacterized protein LOC110461900 [Mizuhopecten yessoensis]OWF41838.1 Thioredoxin domain-containing protein 2 [Mizuhopecten yessoensis]